LVESSPSQVSTAQPTFEDVWRRIQLATNLKTQRDLALALKISSPSVSDAKGRGTFPLEWAFKLSRIFELSLDYLLGGGEVGAPPVKADALRRETCLCDPEIILVPKVKARLSAGTGSLETNAEIKGRFGFRSNWIRSKGNPASMVLMDVSGDSMSPAIEEGDTALIDQSQTDVYVGKIYAIGIDNEVFIKYVDRVPGKFILRSANKDYAPIPVDLDDESCSVRIIGRVVWWCREAR